MQKKQNRMQGEPKSKLRVFYFHDVNNAGYARKNCGILT